MTLRYGSVCSGIEAATMAWHPLGWSPAFFAEIEKFPSAVLAHHYGSNMPGEALSSNGVPNHGDMSKFEEWPDHAIDLLVGGTPCQDYSVAGKRLGMAGSRGQLTLSYIEIAARYRPRWVAWENVPGVLSSNEGRDFARFLGELSGQSIAVPTGGWKNAGIVSGIREAYGLAYRVLDAQYVRVDDFARAVPQRRRRVFVVGYLGDWRRAAAVLLEPEGLRGDPPPRRRTGKEIAYGFAGHSVDGIAKPLGAHSLSKGRGSDLDNTTYIAAIQERAVAENHNSGPDGKGYRDDGAAYTLEARTVPQAVAFDLRGREGGAQPEGPHLTANLRASSGGSSRSYIAFAQNQRDEIRTMEVAGALAAEPGIKQQTFLAKQWAVRRLTPTECHRLQGFPDGFCDIPWRGKDHAPDGPQYKALGNSMAVNVMRWIGQRIEMVENMDAK